jgi:hypothetical protein
MDPMEGGTMATMVKSGITEKSGRRSRTSKHCPLSMALAGASSNSISTLWLVTLVSKGFSSFGTKDIIANSS